MCYYCKFILKSFTFLPPSKQNKVFSPTSLWLTCCQMMFNFKTHIYFLLLLLFLNKKDNIITREKIMCYVVQEK